MWKKSIFLLQKHEKILKNFNFLIEIFRKILYN